MRKYIRNEELTSALAQLVEYRNPEMIEAYREIIIYRLSQDAKSHPEVAKILACPQKSLLALTNMILLPILLIVYLITAAPFVIEEVNYATGLLLIFLSVWEGYRFFRFFTLMCANRKYLLIDELFARKILIIRGVHPRESFKAAK